MQDKTAWASWFEGKTFTTEWLDLNYNNWPTILAPLQGKSVEILEIGSWEGRSAIFFLEFLPKSKITCIDTFQGGDEHQGDSFRQSLATLERRFDGNLSSYAGRVEKIKSRSLPALDKLAQAGKHYDLIYIDGSHRRDDVMFDTLLSWRMLKAGGIMIWDDYLWGPKQPDSERPRSAIDAFLKWHEGEYTLLATGDQVIVEKSAEQAGKRETLIALRPAPRTPRNIFNLLSKRPLVY